MKRMMILAMLAIFTLGATAQKAYKKQVETATCYAKEAQKNFELDEATQTKVFELKKAQFIEMNETIKPMKEAEKPAEDIKATQKEIGKKYAQKQSEIMGCTVKEVYAFNKEFTQKMKAKKKK